MGGSESKPKKQSGPDDTRPGTGTSDGRTPTPGGPDSGTNMAPLTGSVTVPKGSNALPCTAYEPGYTGEVYCNGQCGQVGTVWGNGPYLATSSPCRAALHAGVLSPGAAGTFMIEAGGEQGRFDGTNAHGITTFDYGAFDSSYSVQRAA